MTRASGVPGDAGILADLWRCWADAGSGLTTADWRRPTRLPGWTVTDLYAYVGHQPDLLLEACRNPVREAATCADAADYFRFLASWSAAGPRLVDERSRAVMGGRTAAVRTSFTRDAPLGAARGPVVVGTVAGSITLADYVLTRVVEACVHLLDLRDALPGIPPPPRKALERTADVLVGLSGLVDFVETATGRSEAAIFPVLT